MLKKKAGSGHPWQSALPYCHSDCNTTWSVGRRSISPLLPFCKWVSKCLNLNNTPLAQSGLLLCNCTPEQSRWESSCYTSWIQPCYPLKPLPEKANMGNSSHHLRRAQHHCFHPGWTASALKQNREIIRQRQKDINIRDRYRQTCLKTNSGQRKARNHHAVQLLLGSPDPKQSGTKTHTFSLMCKETREFVKQVSVGLVYLCFNPFPGTKHLLFFFF